MKRILCTLLITLVMLSTGTAFAKWSAWKSYASITYNNSPLITLGFKTYFSRQFSPQVKWQVTNNSASPLYCAGMGNRHYELSDGGQSNHGAEGCKTIMPGETKSFISDQAGESGLEVKRVSMQTFSFKWEKGGPSNTVNLATGAITTPGGHRSPTQPINTENKTNVNKKERKQEAKKSKDQSASKKGPKKEEQKDPSQSGGANNKENAISGNRDTQQHKATQNQPASGDASIEGIWNVFIGKGPARLTFSANGEGAYYVYKDADTYLARWSGSGNHVAMRVYGTQMHYAKDDPAIVLELTIHGNQISGTQRSLIQGFRGFSVKGQKQ